MTERRLIEAGADAFESALLSSARKDRMPPGRKRALALALGAGVATGMASGEAAGAQAGIHGATATTVATKTTTALALKWAGAALVCSVFASGIIIGVLRQNDVSSQGQQSVSAASAPMAPRTNLAPTPATETPAPAPSATSAEVPTIAPAVPPKVSARPVRGKSTPIATAASEPNAASPHRLAQEMELVEQARSALARGDVNAAVAAVAEHARSFPRGALTEEAEVLRIDILVRSGDRAGAERAARAYLGAHPASPHAPRIHGLLETSSP